RSGNCPCACTRDDMSARMTWRRLPRARGQRGQAMVEFAIISLVLILLIAGGIELALAAFSGQRASDAAKAAIEDWVYATGNAGVFMSGAIPMSECVAGSTYAYDANCVDWRISNSPHGAADVGLG